MVLCLSLEPRLVCFLNGFESNPCFFEGFKALKKRLAWFPGTHDELWLYRDIDILAGDVSSLFRQDSNVD